ncbi:hypothetical protein PCA31118_04691 [Pandoraea captiosa]|uniref:Uncharacterized protein n=1 Tax=Pandoraea captiosa TaxID=2508302 RepID=A0A5E5ANQ7_9BURK|nr:hypothetical protein [Pandoraea captiosa]VVE74153.1 hypothetical protein PCA31118_04691 [Pandoraea captiosa]
MTTLTRLAGILPRQPQFRAWLEEAAHQPITADDAAEFIRIACGVDSRRELDTNGSAADRFHNIVRRPFLAWRDKQHQPR